MLSIWSSLPAAEKEALSLEGSVKNSLKVYLNHKVVSGEQLKVNTICTHFKTEDNFNCVNIIGDNMQYFVIKLVNSTVVCSLGRKSSHEKKDTQGT